MTTKIKLTCNECSRNFAVSPNATDPRCPKCGGVDWDVAAIADTVAPHAEHSKRKRYEPGCEACLQEARAFTAKHGG